MPARAAAADERGIAGAGAVAARAARQSYGRLLALLASRSGDLAAAEDALADAFKAALETWPERGVPGNPEGWLLTVARNRQRDAWGSAAARTRAELDEDQVEAMMVSELDAEVIPDDRLKLLFVCAHPAVDATLRAPLMLQTVLGVDADVIACAFLVPPTAMAQRLVRVKRKIKDAVIPFELPSLSDMAKRLEAVLEAVYGAFAIGWDRAAESPDETAVATPDGENTDSDLTDEARFLADLLVQLLPQDAEVLGLAACIALANARRAARVSTHGLYVPLESQDMALWDRTQIAWGESLLHRARACGPVGRFQLEAAIQSVHNDRARSGVTDWASLALLYEGLMRLAPGVGAAVGRAIAVGHAHSPEAGLATLDLIDTAARQAFQPAWAARAHLLALGGRREEAVRALDQAIALARGPRVVQELVRRRAELIAR